jgi:hypothetical protein
MALQLERGLDSLAYVRIVVDDQYAPAWNVNRLHQRPFILGLHASNDPEEPRTKTMRAGRFVTAKPEEAPHRESSSST